MNKIDDLEGLVEVENVEMMVCLVFWGLCMLVGDGVMLGEVYWKSEIGVLVEGMRRKVLERDGWML